MIAFKYRACQEKEGKCRDIDMLLGDQVYASPLSQLNDCFEGRYSDNIDVQLNEIAESSHYDMTAIKTQWQELKRTVEAAGIYSLSLSEDGFPNNKVLWSLYAGEYSGFCVEYDTEKLVQNERFPWLVYGLTVRYQKDAPTIDVKDFSSESQLIQKRGKDL